MNARARNSAALASVLSICLGAIACVGAPASNRVAPDADVKLWIRELPRTGDATEAQNDERPVLVVPGAAWLDRDLTPLSDEFRVVFYDLRGRGHSPPVQRGAGMRIEHDVADLERVRARIGVESMSIFGWAYRGGVAVRYALEHPERVERLVLVAPLPARREPHWKVYRRRLLARSDAGELARIDEIRASGLKRRNPELYSRRVTNASLRLFVSDPDHLGRMDSDPCVLPNLDPDVTARLGGEILEALGAWDWRKELEGLRTPTLIVHGSRDLIPIESSREYAKRLPNARLLEIEGVAHMPWLERPSEFFPAVRSFLLEARAARP